MANKKVNFKFTFLLSVQIILIISILILFFYTSKQIIFILLIITFFTTIISFFYYRYSVFEIIRRLKNAEEGVINNDLKSLKLAIAEIARGDLTIQAASFSKPMEFKLNNDLSELTSSHNMILNQVSECINEINNLTYEPCERICYVGADSFDEGKKCGGLMGKILGGRGSVAILLANLNVTGQNLRRKGFQSCLAQYYPEIKIVDIIEHHESIEVCCQKVKTLIHKNPDLKGIYLCEGTTPSGAAKALIESDKAGKIKLVVHDLAYETMNYLSRGVINATLSQNPFAQGYDPVIHLYNFLVTKQKPIITRLLTLIEEVTRENYQEHWNKNDGSIITETAKKSLAVPKENSGLKHFKIAVILPDDTIFWKPVSEGIKEAAKILKEFNVEVKCVIPEIILKGDWSSDAFISVIESLLMEKPDALSLPVFDQKLIAYINKIIENGLAVATYNSEPISFRGLVESVAVSAVHLFNVSDVIATSVTETSHGTSLISDTMKLIFSSTVKQLESLKATEAVIKSLLEKIDHVVTESVASAESAKKNASVAQIGYDNVKKTHDALQVLQKFSENTTDTIAELNSEVLRIKEVLSIINNIAGQTNLLAMNASIEAAHAGERGKGFSIVADEIRTLSTKTSTATSDITGIINTILKSVKKTTDSVIESMKEINNCAGMSENAESTLNDIIEASKESENKIYSISDTAKDMENLSKNVQESIKILDEMNHTNNRGIEEITDSVSQMNEQVGELIKMATLLSDLAHSQENLISQFILEKTSNQ